MEDIILNGRKSVKELLEDSQLHSLIKVVYVTSTQKELIELAKKYGVNLEIKEKKWFDKQKVKLKYKNAMAVLKTDPQPSFQELLNNLKDKSKGLIVILERIQDSYNFGAILRTCAAMGVDAVLYTKYETSPINTTLLKASQGYALKINLIEIVNVTATMETLKKNGFWTYCTAISPNSNKLQDVKFHEKTAIIFGNEGDGVSSIVQKNSDFKVMIPLQNNVDSLNVSVCAGICLFAYNSTVA